MIAPALPRPIVEPPAPLPEVTALGEHLMTGCPVCTAGDGSELCPEGDRLLEAAMVASTRVHDERRGWVA